LTGGNSRQASGARGQGPTRIITDLGVLEPDPETKEFVLTWLHPGVTVEQAVAATGWPLKVAPTLRQTPPPTDDELATLRDLNRRTAEKHGTVASGD
jgi:glutaconate CoA-transferase subunit B